MTAKRALGVLVALVVFGGCSAGEGETDDPTPVTESTANSEAVPLLRLKQEVVSNLDRILVEGQQFPQGAVQLTQCLADAEALLESGANLASVCDLSAPASAVASVERDGSLSSNMVARVLIGVDQREQINCMSQECVIAATDGDKRILSTIVIPWSDGGGALPERSVLTLSDLKLGPRKGRAVAIGRGYEPGVEVQLVQCPARGSASGVNVDAFDCLYDMGTTVKADQRGNFRVPINVASRFERSNGDSIDCRTSRELCAVADPWPKITSQSMTRALFAEALPRP